MSKTSSAGAGATTNSQGTVYTGFGGAASSASATASKGGAPGIHAAALNAGQTFGVLGLMGALFGGFAILL